MKIIFWLIFIYTLSCQTNRSKLNSDAIPNSIAYSKSLTKTEDLAFQPNVGTGELSNYLVQDVPKEAALNITAKLEELEKISLISRGEAHITVITPIEYNVIKKHMPIAEINKIAQIERIQEMEFFPICIGKVQTELDKRMESSYFIVVDSEDLRDLRAKIAKIYYNRTKKKALLDDEYYPHITLGFTKRDLHASDGVVKGKDSCIYEMYLDSI